MFTFKQYISESINDAGIFKAIFVVGLPGAGKSYTISQITGSIAPKIVNTDIAAEFLSDKWTKNVNSNNWMIFRDTSHKMTKHSLIQYLNGMLPLFVDGTSNDVSNILNRMGILESIGYDVGAIFVDTPLEIALNRASIRGRKNGREVDPDFIKQVDARNKENIAFIKNRVNFFVEINNNVGEFGDTEINKAFKATQGFYEEDIINPLGKRHLITLQEKHEKYLIPTIMSKQELDRKVNGWYRK